MSTFKYVTRKGIMRFLSEWHLRLTPPDKFNDPFEMKPYWEVIESDSLEKRINVDLVKNIAESFASSFKANGIDVDPKHPNLIRLVAVILDRSSASEEQALIENFPESQRKAMTDLIQAAKQQAVELQRQTFSTLKSEIPKLNSRLKDMLHQGMPKHIGVICMSRSDRHPLMWAHYAEEHKGAILEFDDSAPCFNRNKNEISELGVFRSVVYRDRRPQIGPTIGNDVFELLALTKAIEWAYEQEVRMLWPLQESDRSVSVPPETLYFLSVPPSAVTSITVGCRTLGSEVADIKHALALTKDTGHIRLYKASVDEKMFALEYEQI